MAPGDNSPTPLPSPQHGCAVVTKHLRIPTLQRGDRWPIRGEGRPIPPGQTDGMRGLRNQLDIQRLLVAFGRDPAPFRPVQEQGRHGKWTSTPWTAPQPISRTTITGDLRGGFRCRMALGMPILPCGRNPFKRQGPSIHLSEVMGAPGPGPGHHRLPLEVQSRAWSRPRWRAPANPRSRLPERCGADADAEARGA